jgi:hypothetical protein
MPTKAEVNAAVQRARFSENNLMSETSSLLCDKPILDQTPGELIKCAFTEGKRSFGSAISELGAIIGTATSWLASISIGEWLGQIGLMATNGAGGGVRDGPAKRTIRIAGGLAVVLALAAAFGILSPKGTKWLAPEVATPDAHKAPLSRTELDALGVRLRECWEPPAGAAKTDKLKVPILIRFNRDGTLASPPQPDNAPRDPFMQAMIDSAVRATIRCQPYTMLSPAKYDLWKEIVVDFSLDLTGR